MPRFRVILNGQILPGHDPAVVRTALAHRFRLSDAQLDQLLTHSRTVIRRDASEEDAKRFAEHLSALGVRASVEEIPSVPPPAPKAPAAHPASEELFSLAPPASSRNVSSPAKPEAAADGIALAPADSVTCPQCGEVQPRRTLCRQCGLDMPRYHAAQASLATEPPRTAEPSREPPTPTEAFAEGESAPLLSLSFTGRLPRMGYLGASLFCGGAMFMLLALSLVAGSRALATLAPLALIVYSFRLAALRLHDTGRSGWMSLLMLVPVLGQIFALALLLIPGDELENDYGDAPASTGGRAALMGLALLALGATLIYKTVERDPAGALRAMEELGWRGHAAPRAAPLPPPEAQVEPRTPRYAYENQVALYSASDCDSCASMRRWLQSQDIHFVEHAIDANPAAAAALREKLARAGIAGQIRLPVLEVNGEMLANAPEISEVQRHLKID